MAKRKATATEPKIEEPKPIRPKLSDFETGIVPGVKWGLRLRQETKAVEKIRSWIKLGELVCPTSNEPDPIIDLLILASAIKKRPPSDEQLEPDQTPAEPVPSVPYVDRRSAAEKLWDSWPEGWQKCSIKLPPVQTGSAGRVMTRLEAGEKATVSTSEGVKEVRVRPDGGLAVVWWPAGPGISNSMCFTWESIEAAIKAGKPLRARGAKR